MPLRLAMWSGPRNISTAMMRSFGSRPDTFVTDEPLYSHYLRVTGLPHPGRDAVIASHESDWRAVGAWLTGPVPEGRDVWYQKHMSHHLLESVGRDWLDQLTHCFLIREPREMIVSLSRVTPNPTLTDTGLPQQVALFESQRRRLGRVPPVVDARDVLTDPRRTLARLCEAVGIPFLPQMLSWAKGRRPTDGVWAPHWYASVENSTGFEPYRPREEPVPDHLHELLEPCLELYGRLHRHRLAP